MSIKPLIVGLFAFWVAGCDTPRYAYSPSAHNVPVFEKKADSKIAINYSSNANLRKSPNENSRNSTYGLDAQGALAVTKHIAIHGSYFLRRERSNGFDDVVFDSSVINYKRKLFEFGAGYFTSIHSKGKVWLQVFAGAGFGKFTFTDDGRNGSFFYNRFYNTGIAKYYIEPAVSFRYNNIFAASLSTRVSVIKFRNIETDYTKSEMTNLNLENLSRYTAVFFEPAFVNSYGFRKFPGFRIEYQLGFSFALRTKTIINYRSYNFSTGVVLDISKLINGMGMK